MLNMLAPGWGNDGRHPDDRIWLNSRCDLTHAIAKVSGASTIVDISKDHLFGMGLSHVPGIDFSLVHLVRDPRAVAFSWQREVVQDQYADAAVLLHQPSVSQVCKQWVVQSLAISWLARRCSRSYVELRYEDFVADPGGTVNRIRQCAGMGPGPDIIDTDGSIELGDLGHPIAGNPGRRTAGKRLTMRLDDEWKAVMSKSDQARVVARCGPLMLKYGYKMRS
jgi:hypothetical protein